MKFFSIGLVLIIVFGYLQGSTIPSKRSIRSLNAKLQTNINGTFIRKNSCNDSENQKTTYKAFHEIDHHCKEADWSDYARKCSFLINSFLQSLKNLVCSDKEEDAHCNFNINTTISHESGESCGQKGINCSLPTITIEATDLEISPKSQCKNFQVVHWDKPIEGNEIKIRVQGKDYHCYPKEQEEEIEYPSSSQYELGDDSTTTTQPTSETLVKALTEEDLSDRVNQFASPTKTTFSEPLNGYTTNPLTDMMTELPETYFQPTTPFTQFTEEPKPSTLIEPFLDQEYRAEEHFSTPPSEYDEEMTSDEFFPTQDIPNQSLYTTTNPSLNAGSETELPPTFQTDSSITDEDQVNVANNSGLLFSDPIPFTTLSPLSETTTSQALVQDNVEESLLKFQEKLSSAPVFEYSTEAVENFKYQTSNPNSLNISPNPELTTSSTFEEVTASNDSKQPVTPFPVYTNHIYQSNTEKPISESMVKLNFTNQPSFPDYDFTPQPTSIFEETFSSYSPKLLDKKFVANNQEVASDKHNPYDSETSLDPLLDKSDTLHDNNKNQRILESHTSPFYDTTLLPTTETELPENSNENVYDVEEFSHLANPNLKSKTDEMTKPSFDDLEEKKDLNDPYYDTMETETTLDPKAFSTSFVFTPAPGTSVNQFTDYNKNTPSVALKPFSTEYPDNSFSTVSDQFLQSQFSKKPQNDQDYYESIVSFPTETPIDVKEKETSPYFAPELNTAFTNEIQDYDNLSTTDTEENSTPQNDFSTTSYNQDMNTSPSTDMPLTENPFLSSNPLIEETTSNVTSIYTITPESQENSFVTSDQSPEPQLLFGTSKLPMSVTSSPFFPTEFPIFTENFENKEKPQNSVGSSTEYSETDFLTSSESNTLPDILNTQGPAVTENPVDLFYTPQKDSDFTYYDQSESATSISPSQSSTATYMPISPEILTQVSQNYEYPKGSPQDSSTLEFQEVTQTTVRPENSPTQDTFIESVTPTLNQASYLPSSEEQPEFSDYSTVSPFPYQVSDEPSRNPFLNDYDENISETTSPRPLTSENSLLTDKPEILPEKSLMFTPDEEAVSFDQMPVKQIELESDSYTYPVSEKSYEEEKLRGTTEFQDPNTNIFTTEIPNDFSITSDQSLDIKKVSETFSTPAPQYFEYDYTSISPEEQSSNNNGYETSSTSTDAVENPSNIVPNFQSSTESHPQQSFATKNPLIYLGPVINPNIELKFDSLIKTPILPTIDIPKIPLINKFDYISTSAPKTQLDYSENPFSHELESSSPHTKQKTLELSVQGSVLNKPLIPSFEFSSQLTLGSQPEATNFDNETNSDSCLTPEIQFKPTDETTATQLPDSKTLTDPQQPASDSSFLITSTTQPEFQTMSNVKLNEDFSKTPFPKSLFINDFEPSATYSLPFTTTPQPADYSSDDSIIKTIFPNEDANQFTSDYPEDYETEPTSSQHTKSTTTINYYDSIVDSRTHQTDSPSLSTSYDPYEVSFPVTSKPLDKSFFNEKSSIDSVIASTFPEERNSKTSTPFLNYDEETLNSEPQFRPTQPPKSKSPDQFDDYFQPDTNIFESSVSYNKATDLSFENYNTDFQQTPSMTTVFPDESRTNTEFFKSATGVPELNELSTTKKPYEHDKKTELYNDPVSNSAYEEESLFPTSSTPNLSFQPSTIHNYQPIASDYKEINSDSTTLTPREEFKSFDQSSDQIFYPKESTFDLLVDESTKTPSFSEPQSDSPFPNEYFSSTSEDSIFKTQTLSPQFTEQNTPQTNSVTFTEELTTENTPPLAVEEFHTTPIPNTQDKFTPEDSFMPSLNSEDAFLTKSKEFSNDPFMPIFSSTSSEISPKPLELSTMPFDDKITMEKSMAPFEPDLCEQDSETLVTDNDHPKYSQPVTYEDHYNVQKESPYTEFITTQSPSTSQWNQLPDNDKKFSAASLVLNNPTLFPEPTDFYLDQLPKSTIPPQTQLHSTTVKSFVNEDLHNPKTVIDETDPTFFSSKKPSLPLTISSQLSNYNDDSLVTNLPVSVDYTTESFFPSEETLTNTYNRSPINSPEFSQDYNDQLHDRFTNTFQSELNPDKFTLGEHFTSEKPVNPDEKFTTIPYPPFTRTQVQLDLVSENPQTAFSIPEIILDEHNPQDLDAPEKSIDDNCESLTTELPNSTFQDIKTIFQHNSTILSTDGFPSSPTTTSPPPDSPQLTSFSNLNQMEVGTSDSELLTSTAFPPPQSISLTSPEIKIHGQESTISPIPEAFATDSFFSQPDFQEQSTIPDEVSFVNYEINPLVSSYPLEPSTVEPQYIDPNAEVSVAQAAASTFQPDSYALVPDQTTPSNEAGENNISSCSRSSEAALQCPFNPILKGNMTAPSYYILVSKLHKTHDSELFPEEERFKVEKVYLGDGTPLNCTLNTQQTFPNSWYQPIAFSNPSTVMLKTV